MRYAVEVSHLRREFKSRTKTNGHANKLIALDDVDLQIREGELFGLLGPNGAGKTTLIKILSTLLLPTSGVALVDGLDVDKDPERIRERINMVSGGEHSGYGILTVREHLWLFSQLYGVSTPVAHERIDRLMDILGLADAAEEKIAGLSTGMRQKMNLIRGFVCDPKILFLDEPTLGLDVQVAREVRTIVRDWLANSPEKTILLTTHYMAEAEALCDRVAIIDHGKVIHCDTPENLKLLMRDEVVYHVETDLLLEPKDPFTGLLGLKKFGAEHKANAGMSRFQVIMDQGSEVDGIVGRIESTGRKVRAVTRAEPTLEDVFIHLVGRKLDDENGA
jgi:ABC-2 type transport system ATP-binding protein